MNDINNLKKSNTWKIQLTLAIGFISSKEIKEKHVIQSKSDNIEIMTYDKVYEAIEKFFESIFCRYQTGLE